MSHSRFLSLTSVLVAPLALWGAGCGDDTCGVGDAPADGIAAANVDVTLTYTAFTAGANGDCPVPDAPATVKSLTIMSTQENGMGLFTACVPRPDLFAMPQTLGTSLTSEFGLVDFSGSDANNCKYALDRSLPPTGTALAINVCGNGIDKAGFILTVNGAVSLIRKCGQVSDSVTLKLDGRTAVLPQ